MIETSLFSAITTPGVALLILSTTMRLGNNRAAIIDYARLLGDGGSDHNTAKRLLRQRSILLGQSLQLLYLSLIVLLAEVLLRICLNLFDIGGLPETISVIWTIVGFGFVLMALILLFRESRLAAQSMILMADELVSAKN